MEEYLSKGIKEVISQFPEVGGILDEYDIGCAPCSVGTCLLKDIVEIHNLLPEQERELMARIAKVIYPGEEIQMPEQKKGPQITKEIKYSPPMKRLVNEHVLIKRWVALIPRVIEMLDLESKEHRQLIRDGVDFIRSYADKYHHAKEEEILFKYFDEDLDIINAMREEHDKVRGHVKAMLEALDRRDREALARHLNAYREILTEHIKKEDEILYPWMDRNLSTEQVGELFSKFHDVEEEFGGAPMQYEDFIQKLEANLKLEEVTK